MSKRSALERAWVRTNARLQIAERRQITNREYVQDVTAFRRALSKIGDDLACGPALLTDYSPKVKRALLHLDSLLNGKGA